MELEGVCMLLCRGRQVALDVATALDYMHTELGMLHSDLKSGRVPSCMAAGWCRAQQYNVQSMRVPLGKQQRAAASG